MVLTLVYAGVAHFAGRNAVAWFSVVVDHDGVGHFSGVAIVARL